MPDLYALLVGVNQYRSPGVPDLRGCVRDVQSAAELLRDSAPPGTTVHVELLLDDAATRDAVIAGLRGHLGRAGTTDTALFWFSGHGSEVAPVPEWAWFREPGGRLQTLVCADSRTPGVPDLWDKELSVLLDVVAERAGHVAVILDSCHSDGATRELYGEEAAAVARSVRPGPPRAVESLIAEVRERAATSTAEHVVLAACRATESAQEMPIGGVPRGVFSWSLLEALRRTGATATYRELLAAVQTGVERYSRQQVPQLRPAVSPLADHHFLDGRAARRGTGIRMRRTPAGWEIDAGAVHGLPGAGIRVGVRGAPVREAVVTRVGARSSLVEPEHGWEPDADEQFPVVVTEVPLPRTTVAFDGDPAGCGRIAGALATAGPAGGPSPHLLPVGGGTTVPDLRARVSPAGRVTVTDHHGERVAELTLGDGEDVRQVVGALEHIARWRLLLRLDNPATSLIHPVRVEIVLPEPGQALAPKTGGRSPEFADGSYRLPYRRDGGGWAPPEFFIRLHNTTDRMLYCVLLDLTPRFQSHATLFPGDFIAPGERGAALDGRRVQAHLPSGVLPAPGVSVLDRLRLFVAEEQFSQQPFLLPPLGGYRTGRAAFGRRGLMERLAGTVVHRDLSGIEDTGAYDWTTETVLLRTEVPG